MSHSERPRSIYQRIGGAPAVRELVDRFYDRMDQQPEAAGIRAMHPANDQSSRDKLRLFLTGWLGGPPLYVQKYGHPRLRARHLPFAIGSAERDQWLLCMNQALDEQPMDSVLREQLKGSFFQTADFMRNQPGDEPEF